MSELNKKEFIQQFIIHASGPMLSIVNDRGEQRFSESDVTNLAKSYAEETCKGMVLTDSDTGALMCELNNIRVHIKKALEEHLTSNDWRIIRLELERALASIVSLDSLFDYVKFVDELRAEADDENND
jgi:hypothetical protein